MGIYKEHKVGICNMPGSSCPLQSLQRGGDVSVSCACPVTLDQTRPGRQLEAVCSRPHTASLASRLP